MMNLAKVVAALGVLLMTIAIGYAFIAGDFASEGQALLAMPWGIVSLVDLYVGFTLFSGWIIYREQSWWRSVIWIGLLMTLGFFTGSLYALIALMTSRGDWTRFWLGRGGQSV